MAVDTATVESTQQAVAQAQAPFSRPSVIARNARVWIRIRGTATSPETLVPGIVVDPNPMTRPVIRSQSKGGGFDLPNSIVAISYRAIPGREPFYTERAESLIGITTRHQHVPAVDGPEGADINAVVNALREQARLSLARLSPQATESQQEAVAAELASAPTLAL